MTSTPSRFVLVMVVAIAGGAAACGGSGTASLTGPSTVGSNPPAGTGATITGHVNGGSASRQTASVLADSAPRGLTVSIKDSPCASVKNGTAVEVKGRAQSDGSLVAARVEPDDAKGEDVVTTTDADLGDGD